MRELKEAFRLVGRYPAPLLTYLAVLAAMEAVLVWAHTAFASKDPAVPLPLTTQGALTVLDIAALALSAAALSITFCWLAGFVDKPLWKVKPGWTAVKTFFGLWFTLQLVAMLMFRVLASLARQEDGRELAFALLLPALLYLSLIVPLGACCMFKGRPYGLSCLNPLSDQAGAAFAVLLFSFLMTAWLQLTILQTTPEQPLYIIPLLDLLSACADFVVFAAIWVLCMADRDQDHHLDF